MTLCNVGPWLQHARRERFALGAFNANTMEQMQAIVHAAQEERAPVIIQVSHNALRYVGGGSEVRGLQYMADVGKVAARQVTVPVGLHLDHAHEREVLQAIALGFTSVMFDGATLPFAQNVAATRRLCEVAHAAGVFMEAEVGEVPRAGEPGAEQARSHHTDPRAAAEFVQATGVDALAVAIGSLHGVKEKRVELDLERLEAIGAAVDVPLVLHGSSGVTDEHIAAGIRRGLCKINIATQLNKAFTAAVRATLAEDGQLVDPRKYLDPARSAMKEVARERLRFVGAAGRVQSGPGKR